MAGAFSGKRKMGTRERSELFTNRKNRRLQFDFLQVDRATLLTALNVAIAEGVTLSFAPAQGGIGVTLRVYMGDKADTEFAGSVEELEELLTLFVIGLSSKSEDPIAIVRMRLDGALAAD